MNVQDLMQAGGLKMFLLEYHKILHAHCKFPPLTGMKPMHRAAEVLNVTSGEALNALWTKSNLVNSGTKTRTLPRCLLVTKYNSPVNQTSGLRYYHQRWMQSMAQKDPKSAIEAIGASWHMHQESLLTAVRLGISFRRNWQKNDAAHLFTHAVQLAESWQPQSFSWENAVWEPDNDEVWSLGIAFISLAGMHMENGCRSLSLMYFDRWINTCERTDNISTRMKEMLAVAKKFRVACESEINNTVGRVNAAQPLVDLMEFAAVNRCLPPS